MRRRLMPFLATLINLLMVSAPVCIAAHYPDPVPSPCSVTLFGTPLVGGDPLAVEDELSAYSVHPKPGQAGKWEKTLVGHAAVTTPGSFSGMLVYGDDPLTTGTVEGCLPGEEILLVIWKAAEGVVSHVNPGFTAPGIPV